MTNSDTNLRIGDSAPDFSAQTTHGPLSFHQWIDDAWCILFSHPKDFTPVCTTELGAVARMKPEFDKRNVKIIALSVSDLNSHEKWIEDINETQHTCVNFPIIGDLGGQIARQYGMIHPHVSDTVTVRTVFVIDPKKKVRLTMCYPPSTGRNFKEILRVVDSLQLTDLHSVATPANWEWGCECVILPSINQPQDIQTKFPKGYRELKPYLRLTPQPQMCFSKKDVQDCNLADGRVRH
jgi:alkyl hydroperoxide reductase subunit AhpC